ncbi:aldose epimerase family protein [Zunongwangia sp. F363]|uniref:Aldose 1-epimerase n=1 Tax=Autumnicola tepida TaxID=3075595 RepID=A0ABU3CCI5_9FLAO|nr:aldose epimerase family protein [Zunongwangia sp. F363]MDT0644061.1 aldose epimerase family protein [Zunongwangia sp. F363]
MRLKLNLSWLAIAALSLFFIQCRNTNKSENEPAEETAQNKNVVIEKSDYGTTPDGEKIEMYTLSNSNGMEVQIITYGGRITKLTAPDLNNNYQDVVLGFDSIGQYLEENPYFGAIIGRYGNRIAGGKFSLDGEEYTLPQNNGENTLHGGDKGFDKVIWKATPLEGKNALKLSYTSKDMEQGFPGQLETTVTYELKDDNSLNVEYKATTDKKTIVNLTQHSYFNLSGDFSKDILDHKVEINADEFIPVNENLIPTGEIRDVQGTPFDFREAQAIGKNIEAENEQILRGNGYDHCWVLNEQDSGVRYAASAYDPDSGRYLEVYTDEPGMQFYTANFLNGTLPAKGGGTYGKRTGFCFETQHYPDTPNQEGFPTVVLEPGETYTSNTSFRFSAK